MKKLTFSYLSLLFILLTGYASAQSYVTLTGKVLESQSNKPLPDCNVFLSGLAYGTFTDDNGIFTLRIPNSRLNEFLVVSYVGYLRYSIKAGEITGKFETICMKDDEKILHDLVIVVPGHEQVIRNSNRPEDFQSGDPYLNEAYYKSLQTSGKGFMKNESAGMNR